MSDRRTKFHGDRDILEELEHRVSAAQELESADARQHQVEHDEVGRVGARELERLLAVAHRPGRVAGALEIAPHDLGDRRLVVDDEDRASGSGCHVVG